MQLEIKKYLFDIQQSVLLLLEFTQDRDFGQYEQDAMLRAAVERQFEIIGEALAQPRVQAHYRVSQHLDSWLRGRG